MCGIAGIIERNNGNKILEVQKMLSVSYHRGPDASDIFHEKNVTLGHNRLSIIDTSDRSNQPYQYKNLTMVYNGEIYNYIELKEDLKSKGYSFQTSSDTEVLVKAFYEWGEKCFNKLNGMFAFAIYNSLSGEIILVRDQFGIKPLYYHFSGSEFSFASEIKQILQTKVSRQPNETVLLEYLTFGYENYNEETFFDNIFSLDPGTFLKLKIGCLNFSTKKFYELPSSDHYANITLKEAKEKFTELLIESIAIRLRADVKVGTLLSGGLDSSLVTAIASECSLSTGSHKLTAIHAKSIDKATDESDFAIKVAERAGIVCDLVVPDISSFTNILHELVYTQEEPFGGPSMYMGWHVFERARKLNCKVMLNGQGADEIFLGYERYFPLSMNLGKPLKFLYNAYLYSKNSRVSFKNNLLYYFYFRNSKIREIRSSRNNFFKNSIRKRYQLDNINLSAKSYHSPYSLQKLEIESLQLPHLLRYEDRNSMRHSVETRLPFLDPRLVEFGLNLPLEFKLNAGWSKYIVRKASEHYLSKSISWRREKFGFEAPTKIWFGAFSEMMYNEVYRSNFLDNYVDKDVIRKKYLNMSVRNRWALFNVAVWSKVFNVN